MEAPAELAPLTSRGPDNPQPLLAELGSDQRWQQLQRLRRGSSSPQPWLEALASGSLAAETDWLAAVVGRLDPLQVKRLLALLASRAEPLLEALRSEMPAASPAVRALWLEPLLDHSLRAPVGQRPDWLRVLGLWRDPRVAQLLRQAAAAEPLADPQLLVLLGYQRQAEDAPLLQRWALEPASLALRQAALEGLAVGLAAWPLPSLRHTLTTLAEDLHPALAGKAVDLLARLPDAQNTLQELRRRPLDPAVTERLQRRLWCRPLVLIVHGRQGGLIPPELQALAGDLAARRGAPVLLQALTAEPPQVDGAFWESARRAEGFTLVPLLLLPGGHVRLDLPRIAGLWRARAAQAGAPPPRRLPFLGAWPQWQQQLAATFSSKQGLERRWLHHPLQGRLAQRYLDHLTAVFGCPGLASPYTAQLTDLGPLTPGAMALLPLTLAANRLTESLTKSLTESLSQAESLTPKAVLSPGEALEAGLAQSSNVTILNLHPPLLHQPAVRQFLISALEALP